MATMSQTHTEGLSLGDHNSFRCWVAVMEYGKQTLFCIFNWAYTQPNSQIKEQLLRIQSPKQYRHDFDASQRAKIEKGEPTEFDITLLYLLLQRICGLPRPVSPTWTKSDHENLLPNLLHQIKANRNDLAHSKIPVNFNDMCVKLDVLSKLFCDALQEAGKTFKIAVETVTLQSDKIVCQVQALKHTAMGGSTLANLLQSTTKEKTDLAKNEARSELNLWYSSMCKIRMDLQDQKNQHNVEDVFTHPLIKHDTKSIIFNEVPHQGVVELSNIFMTKAPSGEIPSLILILSHPGFGKTTLAKYVLYCWNNDVTLMEGLDRFEIVLYVDFRSSHAHSLDEYLKEILPKTTNVFGVADFKRFLMSMDALFILDNIDNIRDDRRAILDEIWRFKSQGIRYLATSTQNESSAFNARSSPHHKPSLPLHLKGLYGDGIGQCVNKLYNSGPLQSPEVAEQLESFCSSYLLNTKPTYGVFHSPEILSYTFSHWLFHSTSPDQCTTHTKLYLTNLTLLQKKIRNHAGVQRKIFQKIEFDKHLHEYLTSIFRLALINLQTAPRIQFADLNTLIELGKKIDLPYEYILPALLNIKEETDQLSLQTIFNVSFHSVSLQLFYSALYIVSLAPSESNFKDFINRSLTGTVTETQVILKYVIGLMCCGSFNCINNQFEQVIAIVADKCKPNSDLWLQMLEESNANPIVFKCIRQLMGKSWSVEDINSSSALINLLKNQPPELLTVAVKDVHCCTNIIPILRVCSSVPNMQLNLHLFCHFWMKNDHVSDEFLTELRNSTNTLTSFAGQLSVEAYPLLPNTLLRLALQIKLSHTNYLNEALLRMPALKMLYLTVHMPDVEEPFRAIRVPNRETIFSVDLWDVTTTGIEKACMLTGKISTAFCRLVLRRTNFTYEDAKQWIEGIRQQRIHVDTLVIGSSNAIDTAQEDLLKTIAGSFECFEFKWLKLDIS